jgi:hypothetical protein
VLTRAVECKKMFCASAGAMGACWIRRRRSGALRAADYGLKRALYLLRDKINVDYDWDVIARKLRVW